LFSTAKIANFTEQELRNYEESMKAYWDYRNTLAYAKKEGLQEGMLQKAYDMAKSMLADHEPLAKIMRYTGLSRHQLATL
jgi:predicted transposase/invertase (TIGR01784 family)